ncbi:MAG: hypothetical protein NT139_02960 [Candidatus Woesearchaeota archaeon]|nr:hypothetical protein [Candidatus Woesearchaeota archaeon]
MNKKGTSVTFYELIIWIWRIVFLIIVIGGFVYIINLYETREIKVQDLELNLIGLRTYYSGDCFAYKENNRVYTGIIDFNKFNEERLSNCLAGNYLIKLNLQNKNKTIFLNKQDFEYKEQFCKFQNFYCSERKQYVLINDNGKLEQDMLTIKVIKNE